MIGGLRVRLIMRATVRVGVCDQLSVSMTVSRLAYTRRLLSSTSATTLNHNKADANKIGRVIFSGIQPTGVPHVSSFILT